MLPYSILNVWISFTDKDKNKMNQEIPIRIILENPPPGVDFGIQKERGSKYETILKTTIQ